MYVFHWPSGPYQQPDIFVSCTLFNNACLVEMLLHHISHETSSGCPLLARGRHWWKFPALEHDAVTQVGLNGKQLGSGVQTANCQATAYSCYRQLWQKFSKYLKQWIWILTDKDILIMREYFYLTAGVWGRFSNRSKSIGTSFSCRWRILSHGRDVAGPWSRC